MKRIYFFIMILVLTLFAVLPVGPAVFAKDTNAQVYQDGEYDLPFEVLQGANDEVSVTEEYIEKPAKLIVNNGEYTIEATLKNNSWWQYFQVESDSSFVDVTEVSKDEDANTSVVQFDVKDIDEVLSAKVHIIVTGIPGFEYDSKYDIRFKFDTSEIPLIDSETEEPGDDSTKIDLEDGNYTIEFETLHETEEKNSTAASYLKSPANLSVTNGKGKLEITLTDNEAIKEFKTEQNGEFVLAEDVKVNKEANTRIVTFDVDSLESIINAKIKVYVAQMDYSPEYGIRLKLDEESIKKSDENTDGEDVEKPTELTNGYYTINYRVLHATEFEKSRMGEYMEAPAKVVLNEDKKTVTITLTDHKVVTDFQIEQNGKFQKAKVSNVNEERNTRDISFEIDDIDEVVKAKVNVFVAEANYNAEHEVRLFFEGNSIKSVVPLTDIAGHWEEENIITAYRNGWFNGYSDGSFGPGKQVKRMQSASLFSRILGLTERSKVSFTDVTSIKGETKAELERAYANGVVGGFPDGTFKPYADVTRAQFALMIYRTYDKETGTPYIPKNETSFSDIKEYNAETQHAIAMLVELGIANGYDDGTFKPGNSTTRAQAAKMLVNFKEVLDK